MLDRPSSGERAILVCVGIGRAPEADRVEEFVALARSAGAEVLEIVTTTRRTASPRYLLGTGKVEESRLEEALKDCMDLSPRGIRQHLGLNRPIYARTAAYGHFGRPPEADGGFSWEKTDRADDLRKAAGVK